MGYSSASEGEILESDGETKATTTQLRLKDGTIDRDDRPRSLESRSARPPQLDGTDDANRAADSDTKNNGRMRDSDTTSRGSNGRLPHGQKRRYEDDSHRDREYPDPRRFKVHYEGNGSQDTYTNRSRGSSEYRGSQHQPGAPHHTGGSARDHKEQTRANSYRDATSGRGADRGGNRDRNGNTYRGDQRGEYDSKSRRSSTASSMSRESTPLRAMQDHRIADGRRLSIQGDTRAPSVKHGDSITTGSKATLAADLEQDFQVLDEAAQIEERRKRREALRAKHKTQETSLLHKALQSHAGSSTSNTVPLNNDKPDAVSTTASSPSTPQPDSPGSPAIFSVNGDEELANRGQDIGNASNSIDGPSAADYDPSMDVDDMKRREQQALRTLETAAGTYDETKDDDREIHLQAAPVEPAKSVTVKEFDMFADEDEDDMFAAEDHTKGHRKDDGTQAVRIPEAKQLDRSMLDDWDDPEGYYRIILGELLDGRYHVQTNLGKGVFSAVVRALDTKTEKLVAIKVIRKQESMYRAGMQEIATLQKLAEADPEDKKHVIRLERHFEHKGHLCMVFENLSSNLREILKKFGRDVGINIKAVRSYAQQMFLGLALLKKCEILHADLKPDNVLVNDSRSHLKIADLGSAMDAADNEITDMLVSRFYRAPEIMLGIRHDYAIDMWSVGCTLFELYTGKICFTGPSNNQMLKGIMECRGKIPNRMLKKSEYWPQHFEPDGTFLSQEVDLVTRKELIRKLNISRTIPSKELKSRLFGNAKGLNPTDAKELTLFADLLDKCLAVDPTRRISPTEALKHGFIARSISASKT